MVDLESATKPLLLLVHKIHNLHMMAATQVEAAAEEVVTQVETAAGAFL